MSLSNEQAPDYAKATTDRQGVRLSGHAVITLLLLLTTRPVMADMNFGRDAVNTNENNWNNYTKVENVINFTQLLKMLSKVSSRTIIRASVSICNEIQTAVTQIAKNTANQVFTSTIQTAQDAYHGARDFTAQFVHEYKWRIVLLTLASCYGYLAYTSICLRLYFNQQERWFNWNEHLTLEALCATSQKELGIELVKEIQRRYTSINAPTDFVSPLITFLQLIDQEQQQLELYIRLGPWIERLRLCTLTGYSPQLAKKCAVRRRRVAYLRATFMRWMAEYKLEQNAGARSLIDERLPFLQFIAKRHLA